MTERLKALADAGVSIWLDDLSRERIETGNLADLVNEKSRGRGDHQPDDLRGGDLPTASATTTQVREAGRRRRRRRRGRLRS